MTLATRLLTWLLDQPPLVQWCAILGGALVWSFGVAWMRAGDSLRASGERRAR